MQKICKLNSSIDSNDSIDRAKSEENNMDEEIIKMIPIMIIPCKDFNFPEVKNTILEEIKLTNYFKKHHIKCKNCEITNNNNINLREILLYHKKYEIQYQISDEDDYELEEELENYYNLNAHDPFIDPEMTTIKIKHILNYDCVYDDCLFISWIIKK
jgi:hypothetical protein